MCCSKNNRNVIEQLSNGYKRPTSSSLTKSFEASISLEMKSYSTTSVLVLLVILAGALRKSDGFHIDMPENLKAAAKLLHTYCVGETKVDESLISASVGGYLPQDDKLACYIHCIFDTAGLIHTDTGKIRFDEVSHLFPDKHKGLIDQVTKECETIRKCCFNCDGRFPGRADGVVQKSLFFNRRR